MTLDKIDLIDRKFSKSLLGYSRDDVDRLVAEAADTIGRLAEEKMGLARTVEELRREVEGYRSREATLRDTLLTTQTIVEDLKTKARHEAEHLLDEAKDQAAALVQEADARARGLSANIDALRQRKTALMHRFREMLMAALDILDAEEGRDGAADAEPATSEDGATAPEADAPETSARAETPDGAAGETTEEPSFDRESVGMADPETDDPADAEEMRS